MAQHAAITAGSAAGSNLSDEAASRNGDNQSIGALALGGMSLADYVGVVQEYPNLVADARAVFKAKPQSLLTACQLRVMTVRDC